MHEIFRNFSKNYIKSKKKIDFLKNLKYMLELATVRKKTCPYTLFHISGNPL